jgi:hypothetical protein
MAKKNTESAGEKQISISDILNDLKITSRSRDSLKRVFKGQFKLKNEWIKVLKDKKYID